MALAMELLNVKSKLLVKGRTPNLRAAWRPYLVFLKCFGIVNCRSDDTSNPWSDPWTVAGIACLVNTWVMLLIRLQIIKLTEATTKGELSGSLVRLISVISETVILTSLFVQSVCGNAFQNIFLMWSQLPLEPGSFRRLESRVKMASWCLLGIFLLLSLLHVGAYAYENCSQLDFSTVRDISHPLRCLGLFASAHMVGFCALICVTLCLLFAEVNSVLGAEETMACFANVKAFSVLFRLAAAIVSAFDSVLALVIGSFLLSFVCQMVLNTYLVFMNDSARFGSGNIYWMMESVLMLLIMSLLPAMVNVQAHRSYQMLCLVATEDMPVPIVLLVNGLQNRLSTSSIGLSAFHIRVIDMNLIPSMISIYFTYIFLIVQFRSSDVQCEDLAA